MKPLYPLAFFWGLFFTMKSKKSFGHDINQIKYWGINDEKRIQRRLQLNCPPSMRHNDINEYFITETEHFFSSYSKGKLSKKVIEKLRKKKDYHALLDTIIMATCDITIESVRCVPEYSIDAIKDWNNSCIVVAEDAVCPRGMCERSSNCYWNRLNISNSKQVKRSTRYPIDSYGNNSHQLLYGFERSSYIGEIITYGIIGVVLAVFMLLVWSIYFIGRYCCCCLWTSCGLCVLCSPIPNDDGYYICRQWMFPSMLYIIAFFGIIISSSTAFIGNKDIDISITNSFQQCLGLVEDISLFLNSSATPLHNIQLITSLAADDAKDVFSNTEYVKITANNIISTFSDFGNLHLQGLKLSNSNNQFDTAINKFEQKVSPIVDEIQSMLDILENEIYNNVGIIQNSLGTAIGQIDSFNKKTVMWKEEVHNIQDQEYEYRKVRKIGILVLFIVSSTFAFLGVFGIVTSKTNRCGKFSSYLNISGLFVSLLGSIVFIFASFTLCISIVWYDTCQISNVVTSDFEPILGENIARGANAIFNDRNLAVAFNVTDKIDFQEKLDGGLKVIKEVDINELFSKVIYPLEQIQDMIDSISSTALDIFNTGTSINSINCPFNNIFTKENILQPWEVPNKNNETNWILRETGLTGSYSRHGYENSTNFFERLYDAAGICLRSQSCCLNDVCKREINSPCNSGNDCSFVCSPISKMINIGFQAYLKAYDTEMKMTADLGVTCPKSQNYSACPTVAFQALGHNGTLLSLVQSYGENITETADNLVNIGTTSVGEIMKEVKDFMCNMNVSFVADRYNEIQENVCETMLGGFAQINWSLWSLAIFLELCAVLANLLSTRLRGLSKKNAGILRSLGTDIGNSNGSEMMFQPTLY